LPETVLSAPVTVLDREEIESSGAADVAELLRSVPGIHISKLGIRGSRSTVTVRGSEENSVLVLVDGIPVNDLIDPAGGSVDLSRLSLENVVRIEIVRGPVSSLYGSEAMAGVIHVLTEEPSAGNQPARPEVRAEASLGGHASHRLGGSVRFARDAFGLSLAASQRRYGPQLADDESELATAQAVASVALGAHRTLHLQARLADGISLGFPGNGGGPEFSVLRELARQESRDVIWGTDINGEGPGGMVWTGGVDSFSRHLDDRTPPILDGNPPGEGSQPSIEGSAEFTRLRFHGSARQRWGEHWTGNLLVEWRRETGEADYRIAEIIPSRFQKDRNTAAAGAELAYARGPATAVAGVRLDRPEGHGGEASPRMGVTLELPGLRHRVKANWGQGFRLPSLHALAEPNAGNPDLLPERTTSWDAGWETEGCGGRCELSLTWFRVRYRDLVDFDPRLFRLVNRDEVLAQGVELEARHQFSGVVLLRWAATWQDVDVVGSDAVLRDRPRLRGTGSLVWHSRPDLTLRLDLTAVGRRHDFQVPVPERDVVGGYTTLDLHARWRLSPRWEVVGYVENLLNRKYHEFVGFPHPGLQWLAGLRFRTSH
jgi:outer membrane cobalamin receptor